VNRRPVDRENPERLYVITGGRSQPADGQLDLLATVTSVRDPVPGMQSEHARILAGCRAPVTVADVAADLGLPVSVVRILLRDLLDEGSVTLQPPSPVTAGAGGQPPDRDLLRQVLVGLRKL
jgi:hypothetical protein